MQSAQKVCAVKDRSVLHASPKPNGLAKGVMMRLRALRPADIPTGEVELGSPHKVKIMCNGDGIEAAHVHPSSRCFHCHLVEQFEDELRLLRSSFDEESAALSQKITSRNECIMELQHTLALKEEEHDNALEVMKKVARFSRESLSRSAELESQLSSAYAEIIRLQQQMEERQLKVRELEARVRNGQELAQALREHAPETAKMLIDHLT